MKRVASAFFPAVILSYILAATLVSQVNLASIAPLGVPVDAAMRLQVMLHDVIGMASSYLLLILLALAIGFAVAAGVVRFDPAHRVLWYTLAGFVAVLVLHLTMKALLGLSGIAATRSLPGLISQAMAGAAGGYLFARLSAVKHA